MIGPDPSSEKGEAPHRAPPSQPPLAAASFERPEFPVIRPLEEDLRDLRAENEELRKQLAAQRSETIRTKLDLDNARSRNAHLERNLFSAWQGFTEWFESAAFPMTCIDREGIIVQANARQLELLGCRRSEYLGRSLEFFFRDADVCRQILQSMEGGALPRGLQGEIHSPRGGVKPVLITCEPFEKSVSTGVCCYMQDLTEVLRCRTARERSEGLFRQLTENIRGVFWLSSPDNDEIFYVSPRYETVWGKSADSLYRNPYSFLDSVMEEDRPLVEAYLARHRREEGYELEYRVKRADGSVAWVRDRGFPIRRDDGTVDRIAGLAEDITETKEAEQRLQAWARQQEVLAGLGQTALAELSLQNVFNEAVKVLGETLETENVEILEFDQAADRFLLIAGSGWKPGLVGDVYVPDGNDSHAGFTLLQKEPVVTEDLRTETRFRQSDLLRDHELVSGMTVVIPGFNRPFGVLGVHTATRRVFSKDDANFLQSMANILASAVERRTAEKRQQDLSIELVMERRRLDEILKTLPAVVWESEVDPETGSLSTVFVSDYIETMLGCTKEEFLENPQMWWDCIHEEDRPRVNAGVGDRFVEMDVEGINFRWIARDGRTVWVQSIGRAVRDENGRVIGLRGVNLDVTERKLAEEERTTAQERFQDTLRNVPAIVWELRFDPEREKLVPEFVSDYAETMLPGFDREEWMRTGNVFGGVHPRDIARVYRRMRKALAEDEVPPAEFRWLSPDGTIVWVESYKRTIRDESGNLTGVRGVIVNVSDRKKAELEQKAAEERFGDLLASVPGIVWEMRFDPDTKRLRIIFVSDYFELLSGGYTKEEMLEDPDFWLNHVHPEDREMVQRRMLGLLRGRNIGSGTTRWVRRDGRILWIETSQRVVRDEQGRGIGLRGVTVDVTARVQAEIDRENALQQFYAFMDNSPFVALLKDPAGHYLYANRLIADWFEKSGVEWKGKTDYDLYPAERAKRYRAMDRAVLEKNRPSQAIEVGEGSAEERSYWSVLRFPVPDAASGHLLGVLAVDVTERRVLEREILEISDREQHRLGQELHDGLCQHLLGLALMGRTLADRMEKQHQPQADEVRQLSVFLYDALHLARGLMAGFHLVYASGQGGLQQALQQFIETTGKLFGKNCQFQPDAEFEVTDHDVGAHLFRIAQEATHNAIKHGGPTAVLLRISRDGDAFLLTVENDGTALPDLSGSHPGMGMRTMRYRADLIGATLSFERRPGGGTIVSCRLAAGNGIRFPD